METLIAQIVGGVFGLFVAWLINYWFEMYHKNKLKKLKIQHQIELENYKNSLRKSN